MAKVPESDWPAGGAPEGVPDDQPTAPDAVAPGDGTTSETPSSQEAAPAPGSDGTAGPEGDEAAAGGARAERYEDLERQRNVLGQTLRQMQDDLRTAREESTRLRDLFAAAAGITPAGGAPTATPEEIKLAQRIVGLLTKTNPGFERLFKLAERADDVMGAADFAKDARGVQEAQWERSAQDTAAYFGDQFAKIVANAPLKDLDMAQLNEAKTDFAKWVEADVARTRRYEGGDERKLVDEFIARAYGLYAAPKRRQQAAELRARQDRVKRLPVGGSSAAPVSTGPKKPDLEDEDAVHEQSWDRMQARIAESA